MAKKVTVWSALGSLWTAFWLCVLARVTIPDYPWGTPLWKVLYWDESGIAHEWEAIILLWAIGIVAIFVASFWYAAVSFLNEIRFVGVSPDGKPIFYKRRDSAVAPQWSPSCRAAIDRRLHRVLKHK